MKYIKEEIVEGILHIKINRPEALNALNAEVLNELENCIDSVNPSDHKVVIITGEGKAFVAGADIAGMSSYNEKQAYEFSALGHRVFRKIENASYISIALVNGFALGGGLELALACDIRYASSKAKLGLPEVSLGLIPGFGGTQRLTKLVGSGIASEWVFSADMFTAEEAKNCGVVNQVYEPEDLNKQGLRLALSIQSRGRNALQSAKLTIRSGMQSSYDVGLELENKNFSRLFGKAESTEGMTAFLAKRKPNF